MKTQTTPTCAAIDLDRVLERLNGNRAMLSVLATFFLEDAPQLLERLHDGLRTNSLPQVLGNAHSLRGLASTFEPTPVVQLAAEIENDGRNGDSTRFEELTAQLDVEFVRLIEALKFISSPTG